MSRLHRASKPLPRQQPAPRFDQTTLAKITPEIAAALLETRRTGAAPIRVGVQRYVDLLKAGCVDLPGEIFVLRGKLVSSPHRCCAIKETGITARLRVVHDGTFSI